MKKMVNKQIVVLVDVSGSMQTGSRALESAGLPVSVFSSVHSALETITSTFTGAIVADMHMPEMDGLQLLAQVREVDPEIPVIFFTGKADVSTAIAAVRSGAFDFITKPFANDHFVGILERALNTRRLIFENRVLRAPADVIDGPLIGRSPAMTRLRERISQLARAEIDVLIEGEAGVGKRLVGLLLHRMSARRGRPFVTVGDDPSSGSEGGTGLMKDIATTLPDGELDLPASIGASDKGTLFLHGIDRMPARTQEMILRLLKDRELRTPGDCCRGGRDHRVIASAQRDLQPLAARGDFNADLLERLGVVKLHVAPLRERREDIPLLFAHFAQEAALKLRAPHFRMTEAVRQRLMGHDWPGNVRELRDYAFAAAAGMPVPLHAISPQVARLTLAQRVERFEALLIREALQATVGDIRTTMDVLGLPRKTLYDKLGRHEIDPAEYRKPSAA